jgi:hypothetical protein
MTDRSRFLGQYMMDAVEGVIVFDYHHYRAVADADGWKRRLGPECAEPLQGQATGCEYGRGEERVKGFFVPEHLERAFPQREDVIAVAMIAQPGVDEAQAFDLAQSEPSV